MVPLHHRPVGIVGEQEREIAGITAISSSPSFWKKLPQRIGQGLVILIPVLLLVLLILYPLAAIILQSVFPNLFAASPNLNPSWQALQEVFQISQNYLALFNSMGLAGITAVLSCILGTLLAILSRRTDMPLGRFLDIPVWIVFFTPSFLIGESWSLTLIRGGIPDQYL